MSSLARRGLRTTVTTAGLAALATGLAGPALAAPVDALPEVTPPTPADVPSNAPVYAYEALQIAGVDMPGLVATSPQLPAGDAFELPQFPSATGVAAPTAPDSGTDGDAPELGSEESGEQSIGPDRSDDTDVELQTEDEETTADQDTGRDSAMQSLDTGQQMADRARNLTNGNTVAPLG